MFIIGEALAVVKQLATPAGAKPTLVHCHPERNEGF